MGYYANGSGSLHLTKEVPDDILDMADQIFEEVYVDNDDLELSYGYQKYHSDDLNDFMNAIILYADRGSIYFSGEDDSQWKFTVKNGSWEEISGRTVYDDERPVKENDVPEFVGQLIDQVQDTLDDIGNKCLISGEHYDLLKDRFISTLKNWKVI